FVFISVIRLLSRKWVFYFAPPAFLKDAAQYAMLSDRAPTRPVPRMTSTIFRKMSGFLSFVFGDASDLGGTDKFRQHNYDELRQMRFWPKFWKELEERSGFSGAGSEFFFIGSATPG